MLTPFTFPFWRVCLVAVFCVSCVSCGSDGLDGDKDASLSLDSAASLQPLGPLRINTLSPGSGSNCGGTLLVVDGQNFSSSATVTVGDVPATEVTVLSGAKLSARVPAQRMIIGGVAVAVRNPDGAVALAPTSFMYTDCRLGLPGRYLPSAYGVVADFNQDGRPDFLSSGPAVLLNLGSGDFSAPLAIGLGYSPTAAASADWNGDQKPDLAFGRTGGQISVLLGDGTGGFGPPATIGSLGGTVSRLLVADWNSDQIPDLLGITGTGSSATNGFNVFLGDGRGGFSAPLHTLASLSNSAQTIAGDWNRDGKMDLAYGRDGGTNSVVVLLGTGTGLFGPASAFNAGIVGANSLVAIDADGDQNLDLIAGHINFGAYLLRGDGTGSFATGVPITANTFSVGQFLVADLNGDQTPDLIIYGRAVNSTDLTWIYFGKSGGGFSPPVSLPLGTVVGSGLATLLAVDVDDDKRLDLIAPVSDSVGVSLGTGNGTFYTQTMLGAADGVSAIGRVDHDAYLDVATGRGALLLLGDGQGGISTIAPSTPFFVLDQMYSPVLADVNGDRNSDLIADCGSRVCVKLGNGRGDFSDPVDLGLLGSNRFKIAAADFNADSMADLVLLDSVRLGVLIRFGSANGVSGAQRSIVPFSTKPLALATGDFNADRHADLVIGHGALTAGQPGSISVLLGAGTEQFAAVVSLPIQGSASSLAVGDVNGDGRLDLVYGEPGKSTGGVLLGDGAGGFASEQPLSTQSGRSCMALGDLNGDQHLDLVFGMPLLTVQLGDGAGNFDKPVAYAGSGCPVNIGDFTGDRQNDVVLGTYLFPSRQP